MTNRQTFEAAVLAPIALRRARQLTPLGIAAIAWYTTMGRTVGIELTPGAKIFDGAECLLLAALWWAMANGRVSAKWGHLVLALLWSVCVGSTLSTRLVSNSPALDFLMLLEVLCACMLLDAPTAIGSIIFLDVAYPLVATCTPHPALSGFIPAVVVCNVIALVLQRALRRSELDAAIQQRAQSRRANARGRQLSELETLQRERASLTEQVAASQRIEATGTLAASLAHELNNLFTGISMSAGILVKRARGDRQLDFQQLAEESARGSHLTGRLLEFSRSRATPRTPSSIRRVVNEAGELMVRMLPRLIELDVRIENDERVLVDPVQLSQVLLNLCLNAARALDNRGTISIRVRRFEATNRNAPVLDLALGTYVEVSVHDRGIGMDEPTRTHAIDPLFTTQRLGNGVGLGLSTAWNIVRAHGGTLAIDSELGAGTTVRFYLPVCSELGE